jgi:uncharacterized protein YcfL
MKRTLLLVLAAAGLGLATGCKTHEGAYLPVNSTTHNLEDSASFVLLDAGAQRSITSSGIQSTRLSDGRLQVSANVRNRENRRLQVQVNCVFKDGQGFVVEDTPFRSVFLDENAQEGVTFTSANDKAQRFTVRVREAR